MNFETQDELVKLLTQVLDARRTAEDEIHFAAQIGCVFVQRAKDAIVRAEQERFLADASLRDSQTESAS